MLTELSLKTLFYVPIVVFFIYLIFLSDDVLSFANPCLMKKDSELKYLFLW